MRKLTIYNSERVCKKCGTWVYWDNGDVTYNCLCSDGWMWKELLRQPTIDQMENNLREKFGDITAKLGKEVDGLWYVFQSNSKCFLLLGWGINREDAIRHAHQRYCVPTQDKVASEPVFIFSEKWMAEHKQMLEKIAEVGSSLDQNTTEYATGVAEALRKDALDEMVSFVPVVPAAVEPANECVKFESKTLHVEEKRKDDEHVSRPVTPERPLPIITDTGCEQFEDSLATQYMDAQAERIAKLEDENKLLKGAITAQDEREKKAGKLCNIPWYEEGYDWPNKVAEEFVFLRERITKLEAKLSSITRGHATAGETMGSFVVLANQKPVSIEAAEAEIGRMQSIGSNPQQAVADAIVKAIRDYCAITDADPQWRAGVLDASNVANEWSKVLAKRKETESAQKDALIAAAEKLLNDYMHQGFIHGPDVLQWLADVARLKGKK